MKEKNEEQTENQEQEKAVVLGQVPTEYGIVYQTPEGVLNERQYLVWLGNMLVEIKQSLVG